MYKSGVVYLGRTICICYANLDFPCLARSECHIRDEPSLPSGGVILSKFQVEINKVFPLFLASQ